MNTEKKAAAPKKKIKRNVPQGQCYIHTGLVS